MILWLILESSQSLTKVSLYLFIFSVLTFQSVKVPSPVPQSNITSNFYLRDFELIFFSLPFPYFLYGTAAFTLQASLLSFSFCCLLHFPPLSLTPILLLSLHYYCPMPLSCQSIFPPSSFPLSAKWQARPASVSFVILLFHYVNDLWQRLRWMLLLQVMVRERLIHWISPDFIVLNSGIYI